LKLLPSEKGGEGRKGKRREKQGRGRERNEGKNEGKRTSERSQCSKFATTPLIKSDSNLKDRNEIKA